MTAVENLPPLHLARGDPAEATPLPIAEAGIAAIRAGRTHYADPAGLPELREAIAQGLAEEGLGTYDPGREILVAPGSAPAIFTALLALTGPGDEVLAPDPGWPTYGAMLAALGRRRRPYPMLPNAEAWLDALRARAGPSTRALILNTPHNPTGAVLGASHWQALATLCAERPRLVLLSDEAYSPLTYDGAHHLSPATVPALRPRVVVTRSFSKAYAMAGWRVGYLAAPEAPIGPIRALHQAQGGGAATMAQAAALWALACGEGLAADFRRRCRANRDYLVEALAPLPGFIPPSPQGTFYLFPDVSDLALSSAALAERLAAEARVFVYPGSLFGPAGEGHLRICFATSREVLAEFVRRLAGFVHHHGK
jgi:aspartate/methionine/tyrosine aminotransferase